MMRMDTCWPRGVHLVSAATHGPTPASDISPATVLLPGCCCSACLLPERGQETEQQFHLCALPLSARKFLRCSFAATSIGRAASSVLHRRGSAA